MRIESWLVAAAATTMFVSCLSGQMMPRETIEQPVPTASGPPPHLTDDPSTQVEKLHDDLVVRRAALSLPAPPPQPEETCEPVCAVDDPPDKPSRTAGCTPGAGAACAATCAQADAICDDAAQICALAKELRTEASAAGRCHEAGATCAAAHAPCCDCKAQ